MLQGNVPNRLALPPPPPPTPSQQSQTPASDISIGTSTILNNVLHCFSDMPSSEHSSTHLGDHRLSIGEGTVSGSIPPPPPPARNFLEIDCLGEKFSTFSIRFSQGYYQRKKHKYQNKFQVQFSENCTRKSSKNYFSTTEGTNLDTQILSKYAVYNKKYSNREIHITVKFRTLRSNIPQRVPPQSTR